MCGIYRTSYGRVQLGFFGVARRRLPWLRCKTLRRRLERVRKDLRSLVRHSQCPKWTAAIPMLAAHSLCRWMLGLGCIQIWPPKPHAHIHTNTRAYFHLLKSRVCTRILLSTSVGGVNVCAVSRISFHLLFECTHFMCESVWHTFCAPFRRTTKTIHTNAQKTIPDKSMVCVIYMLDVCSVGGERIDLLDVIFCVCVCVCGVAPGVDRVFFYACHRIVEWWRRHTRTHTRRPGSTGECRVVRRATKIIWQSVTAHCAPLLCGCRGEMKLISYVRVCE